MSHVYLSEVQKNGARYLALGLALFVVVQFFVFSPAWGDFSSRTVENLAGVVGMSISVPDNGINKLAQDLEQRSVQLTEREKAIDARERDFRAIVLDENAKQERNLLLIITGVTLFLISLIGVNFYLDQKRLSRLNFPKSPVHPDTHAHAGEFTTKL